MSTPILHVKSFLRHETNPQADGARVGKHLRACPGILCLDMRDTAPSLVCSEFVNAVLFHAGIKDTVSAVRLKWVARNPKEQNRLEEAALLYNGSL